MGNQRTEQVFTHTNYEDYTYGPLGQLVTASGKEAGGSSRLQEQWGYGYDAAHNLSHRTNNALVQTFNVTALNELTNATRAGTLTVSGTTGAPASSVTVNSTSAALYADQTFAATNLTAVNGNNTYTAIAHDSLGRYSTNAVTVYLPTNAVYTYDLNGNLLSDGTRNFAYDDENQLISVSVSNQWMSQYQYDAIMRRRITQEYTWTNSAWSQTSETHYIYDGNVVIQERDSNNNSLTAYTRGNDLSGSLQGAGGIGGLLAMTQFTVASPQHYYYHTDGNGNVTMLINSLQLVAAKYTYDPYGNLESKSGSMADLNPYRFSSKEWNENSGLYYYLYRFYDPNLQRWVNRDPIGEKGGINLFAFVINNPESYYDTFGQTVFPYDFIGPIKRDDIRVPFPIPPNINLDDLIKKAKFTYNPWKFKCLVQTDGLWDFKNQPYHHANLQYDPFGNFAYGATGTAFGFPEKVLLVQAGLAQLRDNPDGSQGSPGWGQGFIPWSGVAPYGDRPQDQAYIQLGIQYAHSQGYGFGTTLGGLEGNMNTWSATFR